MAQMVFSHLQQPPLDPQLLQPGLRGEMAEALLWALEKSPEKRPQSAGAFAARLAPITTGEEAVILVIN